MSLLAGVYKATKKDGGLYYRASITFQNKHISLGSYETEDLAHYAYKEASELLNGNGVIENYIVRKNPVQVLPFHKCVILINYRDNHIYFKNPIYLKQKYFLYYFDTKLILKFDVDDLFYYSHHKIMKRGGHLFVSDYGMQVSLLSRYGIKNYSVCGRDYCFVNGDPLDFRYANIEIINKYHGVTRLTQKGKPTYVAKIHLNGDYIIGKYSSEAEAAIAYNKAAKILRMNGCKKEFQRNFVTEVDDIEYARLLNMVKISKKIRFYKEYV